MTLYTGTGDRGETALLDGTRVSKAEARVAAYGDVDELSALLGMALAAGLDAELAEIVSELQRDLFALGARLADPRAQVTERFEKTTLNETSVQKLESWIDQLDASLPTLRRFVLPGRPVGRSDPAPRSGRVPARRARHRRAWRRSGAGRDPPLR